MGDLATIATLVPGRELLETVIASVVAGLGLTVAFSLAIWGVARFAEHSRADQPLAAGASAVVAAVGFACVAGAVVIGIVVMTSK